MLNLIQHLLIVTIALQITSISQSLKIAIVGAGKQFLFHFEVYYDKKIYDSLIFLNFALVIIIYIGPVGLLLATKLLSFADIKLEIFENRSDPRSTGDNRSFAIGVNDRIWNELSFDPDLIDHLRRKYCSYIERTQIVSGWEKPPIKSPPARNRYMTSQVLECT